MTDNQKNRQPEGIPAGGQFAKTSHAPADVSLTEPGAPATASAIIAAGTYPVTLRFVDYDDKLTTEQMGMILEGRWNDAENDVDDRFSDSAYEESVTVARGDLETAVQEGRFDLEWDELDPDEQNEARYAVEERDDSDPVKDLLRNTPPQLMRTSLGSPAGRLSEARWASWHHLDDGGFEARKKVISDLLKESGVDLSAEGVAEAIEELIDNGPGDWHEGVQLDVIFYGDVADAVPVTRFDNDPDAGKEKVLEFAKPNILLIDKWNGSGHDVVIPAPLKRTLARPAEDGSETPQTGRAYLDDSAGGYSWDDVCGLVKSAYGKEGAPRATWA
ncbi:MAG TPA: hypothetical protein VF867_12690 [Arthrobacter sp.]